jgi:hypothetical protein
MLAALFELSAEGVPEAKLLAAARANREAFLERACVRFVVLDKRRSSPALREFALTALGLTQVFEDNSHLLMIPDPPVVCAYR